MSSSTTPTLAAIIIQLGLGLVVFQANPKRKSNQCFLVLSLVIAAWLVSLYLAFSARSADLAEFSIRQASAAGVLYLATLNLLRLSIRQKHYDWQNLLRHSRIWLILTIGVVALCQTKAFLKGAQMPHLIGAAPSPVYGWAVYLYAFYFVVAFVALIISYWRDLRKTTGGEHVELAFILIGGIAAMAIALLLAFSLDFLIGQENSIWFAPFRMIIFSLVIAYGVATRKIMDVGVLIPRGISYVLLAGSLLALYSLVWW